MSRSGFRSILAASSLVAGSLALLLGCGDEEDEPESVDPGPPPYVRITAIRSSSGTSFEVGSGAPPVIQAGCDSRVGLEVSFVPADPGDGEPTFTLRPPGVACAGPPSCGTLRVTVAGPSGPGVPVRSAAQSTPIPLAELGEHEFRVELLDSAGEPITVPEAVGSDTLTLEVTAPPAKCGPDGGGADAGDANDVDAGNAPAGDAAADAPPDVTPDTADAPSDQTVTDGPADAEEDQG